MLDPEIRHAMQLIGIEVERANSLFPTMNLKPSGNCYAARASLISVTIFGSDMRGDARFSSGRSRRHLRGYAGAVSINNDGAFDIGGFHDPHRC